MILCCPMCGKSIKLPAEPEDGQNVRCPFCDDKFAYRKPRVERPRASFACPLCGWELEMESEPAEGQHIRCPFCNGVFGYSAARSASNSSPLQNPSDEGQAPVGIPKGLRVIRASSNGHEIPHKVNRDGYSSNRVAHKFCWNCGGAIYGDAVVCVNCGVATMPTHAAKSNEWLTALLLCIFLGGFGAHRFYVKDNNIAIVQLLLGLLSCFAISWIWALIDLIMLLSGNFKTGDGRLLKQN